MQHSCSTLVLQERFAEVSALNDESVWTFTVTAFPSLTPAMCILVTNNVLTDKPSWNALLPICTMYTIYLAGTVMLENPCSPYTEPRNIMGQHSKVSGINFHRACLHTSISHNLQELFTEELHSGKSPAALVFATSSKRNAFLTSFYSYPNCCLSHSSFRCSPCFPPCCNALNT